MTSRRSPVPAGVGILWRPELAGLIGTRTDLAFVEVIAESICPHEPLPDPLAALVDAGLPVTTHGVGLGLGGAEEPDPGRVTHLAAVAEVLGSPLVSEHVAIVRGGGWETGHLLPVPRTREALGVVAANVARTAAELAVPLALEHVASLFRWPEDELDEVDFLAELVERTDTFLLCDVANLFVNSRNHGFDPLDWLDRLPAERVAYTHIAGGMVRGELFHDTHAHPLWPEALDLLGELVTRVGPIGVVLERDDRFPPDRELAAELDAISAHLTGARPGTQSVSQAVTQPVGRPLPQAVARP